MPVACNSQAVGGFRQTLRIQNIGKMCVSRMTRKETVIMMAYGYSIKNRNSKKNRCKTRQPDPRWILASLAMAAGIFAAPFGVVEAAIVDKSGNTINPTDNVYNIDPQKINGDFAYNRFAQFVLEQGYIANLKFNNADILANLVNSKIDINGVVNGIKNGKIDGHLMFLSPDGIAIGASGVINAGQFTGIVPTRTILPPNQITEREARFMNSVMTGIIRMMIPIASIPALIFAGVAGCSWTRTPVAL